MGTNPLISQLKMMLTDIVHRTRTETILHDLTQAEHVPCLARSDIFWDAFEQEPLDLQPDNSVLSFADMASNNDSGYWTDSDRVDPIPWNSCSNYPAFPESLFEGNPFPPGIESRDNTEASTQQQAYPLVFNAADSSLNSRYVTEAHGLILPPQDSPTLSDETSHQTYSVLFVQTPAQILEPAAGRKKDALMCSDDPFMGGEKADHLSDDYGWVLYHVENL